MRRPAAPPAFETLLERHRDRLPELLARGIPPTVDGRYVSWDKVRWRPPPPGVTVTQWWLGITLARAPLMRALPLRDAHGGRFRFMLPDRVLEGLHRIDSLTSGLIGIEDPVVNRDTRDRFVINSLIEEAVTSSQLEGASTTRAAAARMIRAGRRPRNRDERMILNTYRAMQTVRAMRDAPLTVEAVLALHAAITRDTLPDPADAGRLQRPADERVVVEDAQGRVLYEPPPAASLPARMEAMVRFAGEGLGAGVFLHPVVQAIVLHFWLAFDHPFADGNGRTARALCYWALLRRGYWMFEFISISRFLKAAPAQYARAFLHAETDGHDLTYFIVHQVEIILRAIDDLDAYFRKKVRQVQRTEARLRRSDLNHRQIALLAHALRHPSAEYTIRSHRTSHAVAYATARADLLRLADAGLLDRRRDGGKTYAFTVPADLEERVGSAPRRRPRP